MNDERRTAIIRLLQTRDDHLPEPTRRTETVSGFAGGVDAKGRALRTVSCPDCLANGRVMFGCETCGGSGEVPDPGKDPMDEPLKNPPSDPRRKTHWGGNTRVEDARERDRQIVMLESQLSPPKSEADLIAAANRRGYVWEEQRRRMYQHFDYAALDVSLDALRNHDDGAYHALHAVYIYAWLAELSPAVEVALERGLVFLDESLPLPVRSPAAPHPAHARDRDRRAAA